MKKKKRTNKTYCAIVMRYKNRPYRKAIKEIPISKYEFICLGNLIKEGMLHKVLHASPYIDDMQAITTIEDIKRIRINVLDKMLKKAKSKQEKIIISHFLEMESPKWKKKLKQEIGKLNKQVKEKLGLKKTKRGIKDEK